MESKGKRKGKGKRKEDSLRKVGRMNGRTDTKVILYSVQCYALHWSDKSQTSFEWLRPFHALKPPQNSPIYETAQ